LRGVLIGAVGSTAVALDALAAQNAQPLAVCTLPVDRAARHSDFVDLRPLAESLGIPVIETVDVNSVATLTTLRAIQPDVLWVIGWSQLLRSEALNVARLGAVGFHPSPLPVNRGRAVIPWTILLGHTTTASTLFSLDEGMDSGDILEQESFEVAADETAASLYAKHLFTLARLIGSAVTKLRTGTWEKRPQNSSCATYCARRVPDDGLIEWTMSAHAVCTLVRAAGDPYPGAFTFRGAKEVRVWEAAVVGAQPYVGVAGQVLRVDEEGAVVRCGEGSNVLLRTCQLEGGQRVAASELLCRDDRLGIDVVRLHRLLHAELNRESNKDSGYGVESGGHT
jgi:methionyl-tRNA formyltransferase